MAYDGGHQVPGFFSSTQARLGSCEHALSVDYNRACTSFHVCMAKQLAVACVGEVLRRSLPCASVGQGSGLVILVENKMVTRKQTKVVPAM